MEHRKTLTTPKHEIENHIDLDDQKKTWNVRFCFTIDVCIFLIWPSGRKLNEFPTFSLKHGKVLVKILLSLCDNKIYGNNM